MVGDRILLKRRRVATCRVIRTGTLRRQKLGTRVCEDRARRVWGRSHS